jgi:hypothetical protein
MNRAINRLLVPSVVCIAHLASYGLPLAAGDESALEQHAWKYRVDETVRVVEGTPIRSRYHKETGGQAYVFQKPDGNEALVPCDLFSEDDRKRIAEAIRLSNAKQDSENAAAVSESDLLNRKAAMELCVRTREEAFRRLPRRRSSSPSAVSSLTRHALTSDRFFWDVYLAAVNKFLKHLLPAEQSRDTSTMQEAMRQLSPAELAALDDFVLSTNLGQSTIADYDKTFGEVLVACWHASLQGPAEEYRPIFIEPAVRDVRISLPRGKTFDASSYFPPKGVRAMFEDATKDQNDFSTLTPKHKNDVPFAVLKHNAGKLHGPAIAQFEDGGLMMSGMYVNNERHGKFLVMAEDRSIRYAGEYDRGDKDGLICVFRAGAPLLIQECKNNESVFSYLIDEQGKIAEQHKEEVPSAASEAFQSAVAFLDRTEDEFLKNEKQVKAYVDKVETSVRRWRAAQNSAMSLERFNDLQRIRSNADAALMGTLRDMAR